MKPLLDGKALAKAIGAPPGPWMKDALDVVMAWQLRNPTEQDAQAAIEAVKLHRQGSSNGNGELTSDLIRHFLQLTIRPLFLKAKPDNVTAEGRKPVSAALPKKLSMQTEDESVVKPWKNARDAYSLDLLKWVVGALDERVVKEVWPLVVPPILTLIDDWEAKYKALGAELLNGLLKSTPPDLLQRTGLGEVFEEALLPCLTCLPDLTPEKDSIALLNNVYPTLLTLCQVRYPLLTTSTQPSPDRIKALDTILRRGPLQSFSLCPPNYPAITAVLLSHTIPILDALGIDSVKHLKFLIPLLNDVLSHPQAFAPALETAVAALQAVIRNCWPRISVWRAEVLKGVCLCWVPIQGLEGEAELRRRLRETVELLEVAVKVDEGMKWEEECRMLVEADGRLEGLFGGEG